MSFDDMVFDTRFTGVGFVFESAEFPQGNVVAALGWSDRRGVGGRVRSVCQTGAVAVLRSRRSWATRDEAEKAMFDFLFIVALRREDGGSPLWDECPDAWQ